jgi:uncharacterized protein YndB with AHSA1/START domain
MKNKLMTLSFKRRIAASPAAVYDAWLSTKSKSNGAPWQEEADRRVFSPKVGALYYFHQTHSRVEYPHFGRFLALQRGKEIRMTWMSPMTKGLESELSVSFQKRGGETLLTLKHAKLPVGREGMAHDDGWKYYLDNFANWFGRKA